MGPNDQKKNAKRLKVFTYEDEARTIAYGICEQEAAAGGPTSRSLGVQNSDTTTEEIKADRTMIGLHPPDAFITRNKAAVKPPDRRRRVHHTLWQRPKPRLQRSFMKERGDTKLKAATTLARNKLKTSGERRICWANSMKEETIDHTDAWDKVLLWCIQRKPWTQDTTGTSGAERDPSPLPTASGGQRREAPSLQPIIWHNLGWHRCAQPWAEVSDQDWDLQERRTSLESKLKNSNPELTTKNQVQQRPRRPNSNSRTAQTASWRIEILLLQQRKTL